ncbi:MAG: glutamine amidotransferase-related protein, partial [Bacteroidia bacterium]
AEAFIHAGASNECKVKLTYVHSELLTEENVAQKLGPYQGVLVAPGFGNRGIEGKLTAIRYVRENNIPFLGICLGMQCSVIEFARNVCGLAGAHSSEMDPDSAHKVIDLMEEQKKMSQYGGTMRLGSYDCELKKGSLAAKVYGKTKITERHRHRYEFNDAYKSQIEAAGMQITGTNPMTGLAEVVEIPEHKWFIGVQYHPELKSTVANPHPLFVGLVKAAMNS